MTSKKINTNDIKENYILEYKGELWRVIEPPLHVKPGKGPAYIQVEMKNLKKGTKFNERFRSSDTVEKAELEQKEFQFLYFEGDNLVMADTINYEQITLSKEIVGDKLPFFNDSINVEVEFLENKPLSIKLPAKIESEIVETDPVIKGSTVTSSYKPAILKNGIQVKVPSYLKVGDRIIVKTENLDFDGRAK